MKKHLIFWLLVLGLLSLLFTSCNITGITIDARIYQFVSDLNAADRSNLYLNFHPDCLDYPAIRDSAYLDISFPEVLADPQPYAIVPGTLNTSNELAVTFKLYGPAMFTPATTSRDIACSMLKYGNDWQIRTLSLDAVPIVK
jgi:hypothetical protein